MRGRFLCFSNVGPGCPMAVQEPFLAVVVDPVRTMSSGKVEIGAFRTYPEGYKPPDEGPSEYQTIPLSKIEDFGVHAKQVGCTHCMPAV